MFDTQLARAFEQHRASLLLRQGTQETDMGAEAEGQASQQSMHMSVNGYEKIPSEKIPSRDTTPLPKLNVINYPQEKTRWPAIDQSEAVRSFSYTEEN